MVRTSRSSLTSRGFLKKGYIGGSCRAGACGAGAGLRRRGHVVAAWAVLGVMVPAIAAGSVAVDLLGPVAVAACAVAASLPAWLRFVYLRLFRQAPRRVQRRRGA